MRANTASARSPQPRSKPKISRLRPSSTAAPVAVSHSQVPSRAASSAARRRSSLPRSAASARGGHLMTEHPGLGFTDVHSAKLPTVAFEPAVHLNYAEAVLPIRDGLAKLRDFPAHAGGSGEAVPE